VADRDDMPYDENFPPHTLTLAGDLCVWRYLTFPSFMSVLQRRELFFARLATLAERDPYEGKFPREVLSDLAARYRPEHDRNRYPDGETFARAIAAENRKNRAVNCWHINETESAAMWKLHSGEHGVAIRTTLGRLKQSFALDERPVYIYEVEYLDFSGPVELTLPFYSGYAKRKSFAHEKELRACIFISEEDTLPGAYVRVDLDALIDEVFVAPESEPWIREVAEGVMNAYGIPRRVLRSPLYEVVI
jgi:hypothetical protein